MSEFTQEELEQSAIGHGQRAWFMTADATDRMRQANRYFDGPVPREVAEEIVAWKPLVIDIPGVVNPDDMEMYAIPDRYRSFVCHPVTKKVINIASDGYNPTLHIEMMTALDLASDFNLEVSSAVCLGDGRFIGLSMVPGDDIVFGNSSLGGLKPYLSMVSSLTGEMATGLLKGTIRTVCDNTIRAAWDEASGRLSRKRTRNSGITLTPELVRQQLDFAFAETEQLSLELERLCNINVSDGQVTQVLDKWSPVPETEGRSRTISLNKRGQFRSMLKDRRVAELGQTVGGLLQAHNTWNTWESTLKGEGREDRIARRDMAAADGSIDADDHKFWEIVATVVPEAELAVKAGV